ncbi:MAG TPA: hypothetical protein VII94_03360 [Candidatus Saccharimonadales bacterium]
MKLHLFLCAALLVGCGTANTVDIELADSGSDALSDKLQGCQTQLSNCEEYDHYPTTVCMTSFYLCINQCADASNVIDAQLYGCEH